MSTPAQLFTNNGSTLLATAIGPGATSFTVMSGYGALFPQPVDAGDFFLVTLEDQTGANREIIRVNGRAGDTFTGLERGQEGTIAQAWSASLGNDTLVDHRVTAETMRQALLQPASAGQNFGGLNNILVVAKNGNDTTGDGSTGKPFLTIQKAHDYAVANIASTEKVAIMIALGNYTENLSITRLRTHLVGMASAADNCGVQVVGNVAIAPTAAISNVYSDGITFTDVLISGTSGSTNPVITLGGSVAYTFFGERLKVYTSNSTAKCMYVTNNSASGIKFKLRGAHIQSIAGSGTCIDLNNTFFGDFDDTTIDATSGSAVTITTSTLTSNRGKWSTVSGANVVRVNSAFAAGQAAATFGTSSFTNSAANGDGIDIAAGAAVIVGVSVFAVGTTSGTGRAIKGVAGSVLYTAQLVMSPGTNVKKSSAIGAGDIALTTTLTAA
jgi:hypothetical protein